MQNQFRDSGPDNKESFIGQGQEFGFYFKHNGKLIGVAWRAVT